MTPQATVAEDGANIDFGIGEAAVAVVAKNTCLGPKYVPGDGVDGAKMKQEKEN